MPWQHMNKKIFALADRRPNSLGCPTWPDDNAPWVPAAGPGTDEARVRDVRETCTGRTSKSTLPSNGRPCVSVESPECDGKARSGGGWPKFGEREDR